MQQKITNVFRDISLFSHRYGQTKHRGSNVSIRRVAYSNNCFMFVSAHFQMLNQIASICLGRAAPLMGPLCHYNLTGIH